MQGLVIDIKNGAENPGRQRMGVTSPGNSRPTSEPRIQKTRTRLYC